MSSVVARASVMIGGMIVTGQSIFCGCACNQGTVICPCGCADNMARNTSYCSGKVSLIEGFCLGSLGQSVKTLQL